MVYRGAVSFTLTARAEGELLENNQVVLMMRLSLCMIWISVFQHILTTNPHVPLHVEFKEVEEEVIKENEEKVKETRSRSMDSLYPYFVYHNEYHNENQEEQYDNEEEVKLLD